MAFEILNEGASVVYVLGGDNRYPQAEPDKVDFDILAQGINERLKASYKVDKDRSYVESIKVFPKNRSRPSLQTPIARWSSNW